MRQLKGLNVPQSIREEKLVFDESWTDVLDRWVIYWCLGLLICFVLSFVWYEDLTKVNNAFVACTIIPIVVLAAAYVMYRKATEKNLRTLATGLSQDANRAVLLAYARQQGLEVFRSASGVVILNELIHDFNPDYKKTTIFLLNGNRIYFTILRHQLRLNLPALTSHFFVKKDLRKLLSAAA